ncbi:DUF4174 domain-containing protein [Sphingomonas sp.]|uniref:DUF4174 domain-containing protein n=1 Tax=Sphingomonas sp. TaxID=28214 RepID=UPI002C2B882B|nr:DUF4174 domain-containing protein [Sphingomonas sp.]HTG39896.1 DUF4174 domain-containing protein [Sphingomonas sp.]
MIGSLLPLSLAAAVQPQPDALEKRTRNPRVVMVFAPARDDSRLRRQQALLREARSALDDRDVHVIEVVGDTVAGAHDYATALRQRYAVQARAFGVLLIGRDGGVKLRAEDAVPVERLNTTIDAMPMRQREMRID